MKRVNQVSYSCAVKVPMDEERKAGEKSDEGVVETCGTRKGIIGQTVGKRRLFRSS